MFDVTYGGKLGETVVFVKDESLGVPAAYRPLRQPRKMELIGLLDGKDVMVGAIDVTTNRSEPLVQARFGYSPACARRRQTNSRAMPPLVNSQAEGKIIVTRE